MIRTDDGDDYDGNVVMWLMLRVIDDQVGGDDNSNGKLIKWMEK